MGVHVEEEWRYKKKSNDAVSRSLRGSKSTFAYKINEKRKGRDVRGKKGSSEVFVKFTDGAKSRAGIRNAIKYISRDYNLELYDSEGSKYSNQEAIKDTIWRMQMNTYLPEKDGVDITKSLMFSPPVVAGVSKEDTIESVRKTLTSMYPENYFVMAYHTDTKHPHVHVVININKSNGNRIQITNKNYDEMKKRFAQNLTEYGYEVKATIKKEEVSQEWKELTQKSNKNEYEVVEFGSCSYQLDQKKDRNNYLVYKTHNGNEVTIWGKEIIEEIKQNNVRVGDRIKLKKVGTKDVKVPVYSKDGNDIIAWKNAKRNIWEIKNLSRGLDIKPERQENKLSEIKLEGEERQKMHMESLKEFNHEKNMTLDPEYKQKYEEKQKLKIKPKHTFKF